MTSTRTRFFVVLVGVAAAMLSVVVNARRPGNVSYTEFIQQVNAGSVTKAVISAGGNATSVTYDLRGGASAKTVLPRDYREVLSAMKQKQVSIEIRDAAAQWIHIIANASPFLILLAFWFGMMWKLRGWPKPSA